MLVLLNGGPKDGVVLDMPEPASGKPEARIVFADAGKVVAADYQEDWHRKSIARLEYRLCTLIGEPISCDGKYLYRYAGSD